MLRKLLLLLVIGGSSGCVAISAAPEPVVTVGRLPAGAVQPDAVVDGQGVLHLVYLTGEPAAADVFYVRSSDSGHTFSTPVRVNSQPHSAIATGTIRGAQLAVGRGGRIHVAWNGSDRAEPRSPAGPITKRPTAPMLYARSRPDGSGFEPQRNLITRTFDLDGGGSIAADDGGRVYVAWHGNAAGSDAGEASRRVWLARSVDDGATFATEQPISDLQTGVCGCCAVRLFAAPDATVRLLYRAATGGTHRDIHALVSRDRGQTFTGSLVHPWTINACPMTSMAIAAGPPLLAAWETDGQVYFRAVDGNGAPAAPPAAANGADARRKHPRLAIGRDGTRLLVWTEGTAWAKGGGIAWQAFGADDRALPLSGKRGDLPVWSFAAVIPSRDGFTVLY